MIDLIIPTYNKPELLQQCLLALDGSTRTNFRLIIADDNSPDEDMKEFLRGFDVVYNESGTQGFPHNCNSAVSQTASEFICLLNNDTAPTPLWLDVMLREMDDPTVGIVGAKLLYPPGHKYSNCLQHAGVAHNAEGLPYHIYRGMDRSYAPANQRREINAVTFACALIRRRVWEQIGGLDEIFVGGQFEDIDFCLRTRDNGWKVVYQPLATLYHYEHGSGEEFTTASSSKNSKIFKKRWGYRGSDEYLFRPFGFRGYREQLAEVMQELRAFDMQFALTTDNERAARCRAIARLAYEHLPPEEQEVARRMADKVLALLDSLAYQ